MYLDYQIYLLFNESKKYIFVYIYARREYLNRVFYHFYKSIAYYHYIKKGQRRRFKAAFSGGLNRR
jgi:hypothetical protein